MILRNSGELASELGGEFRRVCLNDDLQLFIGRVPTRPKCVTSERRDSIVVEVGDACRLAFVDEISVPSARPSRLAEVSRFLGGLKGRPYHLYIRININTW